MFSDFRMTWVNAIEQRKYQTIHTWIGPRNWWVQSTWPSNGMTNGA